MGALIKGVDLNKVLKSIENKFGSEVVYHSLDLKDGAESLCFVCPFQVTLASGAKIPLYLKTFPEEAGTSQFLKSLNIFYKEVSVYKVWIRELAELVKDFNPAFKLPFPEFCAGFASDYRLIKDVPETGNYLVLQDLRSKDFCEPKIPTKILDFPHTALAIRQIGRLHALSWAYKQKRRIPNLGRKFPIFSDRIFPGGSNQGLRDALKWRFGSNFDLLKVVLERELVGGRDSDVYKAVSGLEAGAADYILDFPKKYADSEESWTVICHGDLYYSNLLFRYKDSRPVESAFVDLQFSGEASPMTDLVYLLYSSTESKFREKNLLRLLRIYTREFFKVCMEFQVQLPPKFSFPSIKKAFLATRLYGFYIAIILLPVLHPPKNLNNNKGEQEIPPRLSKILIELVQEFYSDGILS